MRKLLDFLFGWLQPFKGLTYAGGEWPSATDPFWEDPFYAEPSEIEARITELQIRAQTARRNKKKHSHFIDEIKALRTQQLRAEAA